MPGDIHSMKHRKLCKMRTPERSPVIFQAKPCAPTGRKKRQAQSIEAPSIRDCLIALPKFRMTWHNSRHDSGCNALSSPHLRETVRGSNGLKSAIQAYRRAKELDPTRRGVRLNFATALVHDAQINRANRGEDLGEAGLLLDALLAKAPDNPQFLNAKAVLLHETDTPARSRATPCSRYSKTYSKKPLHDITYPRNSTWQWSKFKSGNTTEGASWSAEHYLQRDSLSRWAALASGLLHSKHIETPKPDPHPHRV